MWPWILLLALVVFVMYWLMAQPAQRPPGCNTCAKRQVVSPVE